MHELAVAESIVSMVDETAAGRRVRKVTLEIGTLTCISADALRFSFELAAEGTSAAGAELVILALTGNAFNVKSMEVEEAA